MSSCESPSHIKTEPNDSDLEPGQAQIDDEAVGLKVYLLKEERTDEAPGTQSFKIDIKTLGRTNVTLMVDKGVNTNSTNEEGSISCSSASCQTDEITQTDKDSNLNVKSEPDVDVVGIEDDDPINESNEKRTTATQTLQMKVSAGNKVYPSFKRKFKYDAYCDNCSTVSKKYIKGIRFRCLVCKEFDLCADCEFQGIHLQHPMVRLAKEDKFLQEEIPGLIEKRKAKKRKVA